jgi:diacylglycerol kinase (ATP)
MKRLVLAFDNSCRALARAFRSEPAVRQELILLMIGLPLSFVIATDIWRQMLLVGSILICLAVELLNTGLEKLCDRLHPDRHDDIGYVKDLGSAAVLMALVLAGGIWLVAILQWLDRVF